MATTAGPFLRYGNCLPGSKTWTGSALFLTKTSTAAAQQPAKKEEGDGRGAAVPVAVHAFSPPTPVLLLSDPGSAGGGSAGKGGSLRPLTPELLDSCQGWIFWRFDLELQLGEEQRAIRYAVDPSGDARSEEQLNSLSCSTFWLPGMGQNFHWGYFSCNGLSLDVPEDSFTRKDPSYLWRDLLQVHSAFPMHVLVGGGDQVYSDGVWRESEALAAWSKELDTDKKFNTEWSPQLEHETTTFYLNNYVSSFTGPDVATAYASIPSVFVWDDHDIWDGFGSYSPETQGCPVFKGLFEVARRFYLLFQQHTTQQQETTHGKSEFMQHAEGYHSVRFMGPSVAILAVDMRTKRSREQIMPLATYQLLRNAALELPDGVEHLVVLSGVPLVFPKIPMSEQILGWMKKMFRCSALCMSLGKAVGVMDRFGQPEILDDLVDGWVADKHKDERLMFIRLLQEIATAKHLRVAILSGDAHVGGVGRLYGRPKTEHHRDPLYMPQIISSAIMNAPPPLQVVKMLMRTNVAINLDHRTRVKMVRAFWPRHPRTDKLLARRNWCDVSVAAPPFLPPTNPASPDFGALRFSLRVENPDKWLGYAEETYDVLVPRAPQKPERRKIEVRPASNWWVF